MPAERVRRRSTRLACKPVSAHDAQLSFSEDEDMSGSDEHHNIISDNFLQENGNRVFDAPPTEPIQLSKRVQNAKRRKGSGYVPRAQNCFMIFRNAMIRSKVLPTGDMNNATISKVISNTWAAMPESEKNEWREKARQAKFEHSMQYPDYRYRPKHKPRKNKNKKPDADAAPVEVPAVPVVPSQPKARAPRTKKVPTTRVLARDEAQSAFVTQLVLQGIKGDDARERIREWTNQWEAEHPHSEFPDEPVFDGQEATLALSVSRPQSTGGISENNGMSSAGHYMYHEEGPYAAGDPSIVAPVPSSATQPAFMDYSMAPPRSMSQPPQDVYNTGFPGFYHEDPVQSIYPSVESRSWLGHRRSSSVGALQYADVSSTGRRPSTANVLYPQAFQGGNPFFPSLPPSFGTQDQFLPTASEAQEPVFNPSFSFSGANNKPSLPPLSLPPDVIPLNSLNISSNGQWDPYTADPSSSISGPPSTVYSGSQAPSPEPMPNMPQSYEGMSADVWNNPIPVETMNEVLIADASSPQGEFRAMEEYFQFANGGAHVEHNTEHPAFLTGNEIYHA